MDIESNEMEKAVAKGADGRLYDLHKIVQPDSNGGPDKTEWLLSTGQVVTTVDNETFMSQDEQHTFTKISG